MGSSPVQVHLIGVTSVLPIYFSQYFVEGVLCLISAITPPYPLAETHVKTPSL
jgi:hypothetical protein